MKLLSIEYIPGVEFEALGIVKGTVVQTKNVGKDFMAGMKTLVGGEITGYTEMLNEARQIATKRMVDEAKEMNADAVIGVKYGSSQVMSGAAEVIAYGDIAEESDKCCTNKLEIVREIPWQELLTIVNELFSAGAEAISVNGHRITSMSAIYEIGTEFLKVNGEKISSPYVINAIGNSDYLKSAVSGKGGGVDELKELGHETSVNTNKKIKQN